MGKHKVGDKVKWKVDGKDYKIKEIHKDDKFGLPNKIENDEGDNWAADKSLTPSKK
jgi:hypothetical protein